MTASSKQPLALFLFAALLVAAATYPPAVSAGRLAVDRIAHAYQAIYLDSQSFRFACM